MSLGTVGYFRAEGRVASFQKQRSSSQTRLHVPSCSESNIKAAQVKSAGVQSSSRSDFKHCYRGSAHTTRVSAPFLR